MRVHAVVFCYCVATLGTRRLYLHRVTGVDFCFFRSVSFVRARLSSVPAYAPGRRPVRIRQELSRTRAGGTGYDPAGFEHDRAPMWRCGRALIYATWPQALRLLSGAVGVSTVTLKFLLPAHSSCFLLISCSAWTSKAFWIRGCHRSDGGHHKHRHSHRAGQCCGD